MFKISKISILFLIFGISFLLATSVLAESNEQVYFSDEVRAEDLEIEEPLVLPNSYLYILKDWWREIKIKFTFNRVRKEELRLKQMNERLIEVKKLFEQPVDEKTQKQISKVLTKYQEGSEKFKTEVEKLKTKLENNEQFKKLLEKNTDWELKRQYLLKETESKEDLAAEVKNRVRQSMQKSLTNFAKVISLTQKPEEIKEDLSEAIKKGNEIKQMYNLETLKELESEVSAESQEVLQSVKEKTLEKVHQGLEAADAVTQEDIVQEFIELEPSEETIEEIIDSAKPQSRIKLLLQEVKLEAVKIKEKSATEAIEETLDLFNLPKLELKETQDLKESQSLDQTAESVQSLNQAEIKKVEPFDPAELEGEPSLVQ